MKSATIFSRSMGGWAAPFWPAVVVACCGLLLVFVKMTTDDGLAWAVSVEALDHSAHPLWPMAGVAIAWPTLWLLAIGIMSILLGVKILQEFVLLFSGCVSLVLAAMLHFGLVAMDRLPLEAIGNHAKIERAVATSGRADPVANMLRHSIDQPTYAGVAQGAKLVEQSIRGPEMQRAMVAARIIGVDDMGVIRLAKARGWMAPHEFLAVRDRAVDLLRDNSQGKSVAWQAAAVALVDRKALASPLVIQVKADNHE